MIDSESVRYSLQKNTVEAKRLAREIKSFENAKKNLAADMRKAQYEMTRRLKWYQDRLRQIQLTRSRDYDRYGDSRKTPEELTRTKLRKASRSGRIRPVTAPPGCAKTEQDEEDEETAVKNWEMIMHNRRKSKVDLRPQTCAERYRAVKSRPNLPEPAARRGSGSSEASLSSSLSSSRDSESEVFVLATPGTNAVANTDVPTSQRETTEVAVKSPGRKERESTRMGVLGPRHTPRGADKRITTTMFLNLRGLEGGETPTASTSGTNRNAQSSRPHRSARLPLQGPYSARAGTRISMADGTRYFDDEEIRTRRDIYGSLLEQRKRQEQAYFQTLCQKVEAFCQAPQPEAIQQLDYYGRHATSGAARKRPMSASSGTSSITYRVITDEELNKKILTLRQCPFYSWTS